MSKSLQSMTDSERQAAISRRLLHGERGLGYWAAVDAQEAQKRRAIAAMKKAAENAKK